MSSAGMVWARQQNVGSLTPKAILLLLGELSDDTGRVFRGQQYIAETLHISRETVGRNYAKLEELGMISREQRYAQHNVRMNDILTLNLAEPCDGGSHGPCDAESHSHVTQDHIENVTQDHIVVKPLKPKEITTDTLPGVDVPASKESKFDALQDRFDEFYALWPRKVGKTPASKIWLKSVRAAGSVERILKAAQNELNIYNADRRPPSIKSQYVPHPKTWLSQERWENTVPAEGDKPAAPVTRTMATAHAEPHPATLLTDQERQEILSAHPNLWDDILPEHARAKLAERNRP